MTCEQKPSRPGDENRQERVSEMRSRIERFVQSEDASVMVWNCELVRRGVQLIPRKLADSDSPEDFEILKAILGVRKEDTIYETAQGGRWRAKTNIEGIELVEFLWTDMLKPTYPPYALLSPGGTKYTRRASLIRRNYIPVTLSPETNVGGAPLPGRRRKLIPDLINIWPGISGEVLDTKLEETEEKQRSGITGLVDLIRGYLR